MALRLGFLPAMCEAIAIAVSAMILFQFDWATGLLLGCIISAESPAVIVPGMLRLKSLGWGVGKGIADAILTGSALSDVLILLVFSLLLNFLTSAHGNSWPIQLLPIQILLQIGLGLLFGYLAAQGLTLLLAKTTWVQTFIHEVLVTACIALLLVVCAQSLPYFSGYLAVMAFGLCLIEFDPPLARRMRLGFDSLWSVAEIILFVLMGASIQLSILGQEILPGLLLLVIGLLGGRVLGWALSTYGSNWTWKERLFLLPGNSAKATVQAAIGAVPLELNIKGGQHYLSRCSAIDTRHGTIGSLGHPHLCPQTTHPRSCGPYKSDC